MKKKELERLQYIAEQAHSEQVCFLDSVNFKREFTPEVCDAICKRALGLVAENIRLKAQLAKRTMQ